MSHETNNLKLEIPQPNVDLADLTIVSDNFEKVDAFAGDIATIETSPTTKAHSVGEFIIYEGRIYKVTSAISAGGSLVLGTNVSAANLGTELKSLRDSVSTLVTVMNSSSGMVRYVKFGYVIILVITDLIINGVTSLGNIPSPKAQMIATLRNSTNGDCAMFYLTASGTIETWKSYNYTAGDKYSGFITYLTW
jgi:hypothetical protein